MLSALCTYSGMGSNRCCCLGLRVEQTSCNQWVDSCYQILLCTSKGEKEFSKRMPFWAMGSGLGDVPAGGTNVVQGLFAARMNQVVLLYTALQSFIVHRISTGMIQNHGLCLANII